MTPIHIVCQRGSGTVYGHSLNNSYEVMQNDQRWRKISIAGEILKVFPFCWEMGQSILKLGSMEKWNLGYNIEMAFLAVGFI